MIYQGQTIQVSQVDSKAGPIAELTFDIQNDSVNKFNAETVGELKAAGEAIAAAGVKGLLVTSGKPVFIVGADITEFGKSFSEGEDKLLGWLEESNAVFNAIEDLDMPSVTAINGIALGGGFEMALATDYRVAGSKASVGLPEVKLGIFPGFGGTVRLPRLVGADNAIEWIAGGTPNKPEKALKIGAVDSVVEAGKERDAALAMLELAINGSFDWKARRAQKTGPLKLSPIEGMMVFETAKGFIAGKAGPHYPAPVEAVKGIQKAAGMSRDDALKVEHAGFAKVAQTTVADALIGLFLNDQYLKKLGKKHAKIAKDVKQAAVLGAGIMGGGIAYQSAVKGTPIIMKDIAEPALELGMGEATKLLAKQVERKKIDTAKMGKVLSSIRPTLSYGDFGEVDIVVEAVVENPKVKHAVLADVEKNVKEGTILTSNTSSISISYLAEALEKPENFCGMHFFNPVHRMPLVEIIRGEKSSDEAIATTVAYASAMGKTPIVVNDCPGFLVNRILFPYFFGFGGLMSEGADFRQIDKVMEKFGWPMGPAYLNDVVGVDTSHHVGDVLAEGYPDRMKVTERSALDVLYENERFGQKNGKGYYEYVPDRKGKPKKVYNEEIESLLDEIRPGRKEFSDEEIVERHMIPMIIETARCLEEGIVDSAQEADMGLIMGIGFPPFRGGALKYADTLGMANIVKLCDEKYSHLGKLFEPTEKMREMAASGARYYG